MNFIPWLIHTDPGMFLRIAIGVSIFLALAIADWLRNRAAATRWREYTVLLAAVVAALFYGAMNDQITSTISWEYFYYGKDLEHVLGPTLPPDPIALHWEAAKIGLKATWTAGLIFGVMLLLANNPWRGLSRLKNRRLIRFLLPIFAITIVFAALGGVLGYEGVLTPLGTDFQDMVRANVFHPRRFMCTWGIHLGGYVGGLLGTLVAAVLILRARRRKPAINPIKAAV